MKPKYLLMSIDFASLSNFMEISRAPPLMLHLDYSYSMDTKGENLQNKRGSSRLNSKPWHHVHVFIGFLLREEKKNQTWPALMANIGQTESNTTKSETCLTDSNPVGYIRLSYRYFQILIMNVAAQGWSLWRDAFALFTSCSTLLAAGLAHFEK